MINEYVFNYGEIRSLIERMKSNDIKSFDSLIDIRDELIKQMSEGVITQEMAVALHTINVTLHPYQHDPNVKYLMRDLYRQDHMEEVILEAIIASDARKDNKRDVLMNNILDSTTNLWLIRRMKYHDTAWRMMAESERCELDDMVDELLGVDESIEEGPDDDPGERSIKLARKIWYKMPEDEERGDWSGDEDGDEEGEE